MKKAIAMRCTQEQFEAIKPKLSESTIHCMSYFSIESFLVNNLAGGNKISNVHEHVAESHNREVHQEWNEKIFLEACGIEVEETFTITKEQILELKNGYKTEKLKEWFPEVFEEEKPKLVIGKWYKCIEKGFESLIVVTDLEGNKAYGFSYYGENDRNIWNNESNCGWSFKSDTKNWIEATESEVFKALKNEAVKRGYKHGDYVKYPWYEDSEELFKIEINKGNFSHVTRLKDKGFLLKGTQVFFDGKWAEIVKTITIGEAEQKLNCKII